MTGTLQLRALTVPEKRAVAMAARGIPEATITQHTRLTAEQIYAALDRAAQWDRLAWGHAPRMIAPPPKAAPAPACEPPAGPTPQQRAVDLYAGGLTVNQVSVATRLTRAEVRTVLGLEADEPRHLLPATEMPPVLQGVDGSIAERRPPVIATPKAPAIQPRPMARRSPVRPVPVEGPVPTPVKSSPAPKPIPTLKRKPTLKPKPAPAPRPATEPLPAPGTRRWDQLATSPDVRDWAAMAGWQLPPPGTRLPGAIILAYHHAHGGTK